MMNKTYNICCRLRIAYAIAREIHVRSAARSRSRLRRGGSEADFYAGRGMREISHFFRLTFAAGHARNGIRAEGRGARVLAIARAEEVMESLRDITRLLRPGKEGGRCRGEKRRALFILLGVPRESSATGGTLMPQESYRYFRDRGSREMIFHPGGALLRERSRVAL